jgi:uncharacterized protein (DUF305 family)
LGIYAAAILVFALALWLVRSQATESIIEKQREEIAEMKALIEDLEK